MKRSNVIRWLASGMAAALGLGAIGIASAHHPEFLVLHTFDVADASTGDSPTGSQPGTLPVVGWHGDVFGMTYTGGKNGTGVVYRYSPFSREYRVIHAFSAADYSTNPNGINEDGANPGVGLTRGQDNRFFGTASYGGRNGNGTIFEVSAEGQFKVLHTFSGVDADGANQDGAHPLRTLVVGHDGRLYGTTRVGGENNLGVSFVIGHDGSFTVTHQYTADEGHAASLTQGNDGYLYGCAVYPNPALGAGVLYRMLPSGKDFQILHHFPPVNSGGANAEGAECYEPLIERRPGEWLGTATYGGATANGVVFRFTERSGLKVLHTFSSTDANGANSDGATPVARVTLGPEGAVYSTASAGGANGGGTVYRISADGRFEVLHTFSAVNSKDGSNVDGYEPDLGLTWDHCNQLVGITDYGGKGSAAAGYGNGTLYAIRP